MPEVQIVKVFVDEHGQFGDLASIVFDTEHQLDAAARQKLTRRIGHTETVFVDDIANPRVSIFNPQQEVKFAGQPMVGAAWLLAEQSDTPFETIHCRGGAIRIWQADDLTWIQASLDMMPPWQFRQLSEPDEVEAFPAEQARALQHTVVWAWTDKPKGLIRARTFAPDWDIPEAESNGSGSMLLAANFQQKVEVKHGQGSIIYAEPASNNLVNVGGRVIAEKSLLV